MAYRGKSAKRCKILVDGKVLDGRLLLIEESKLLGPKTERNERGELIVDGLRKVSRYTIEVVE